MQPAIAYRIAVLQHVTPPANLLTRRAFSLVELSIVLVILGLLVGGVLSGRSLIRAAELQSVSADYTRYMTAMTAFRDTYRALPGDMSDATAFWGAQDGGDGLGPDCTNTPSTSQATCNGNGDGQINVVTNDSNFYERFRFWQHLANAGLIGGRYTGVSTPVGGAATTIGVDVPASKLRNSGWTVAYMGVVGDGDPGWFPGVYNNMLFNGAQQMNSDTADPNMMPTEMWNLDTKIDDGMPATGSVVVTKDRDVNCYIATTLTYNLTNTAIACNPYFLNISS